MFLCFTMNFIAKMLELKSLIITAMIQMQNLREFYHYIYFPDGDTESALETLFNLLGFSTHMVSLFMFTLKSCVRPHVKARCNVITRDVSIYGVVEFSTSDK